MTGVEPEDVRTVVNRQWPALDVESVVRQGDGYDHVAYEVNGELILRFAREPDPRRRADSVRREAQVLAAVREWASVATPEPVLVRPDDGFLGYRKLPGVPLAQLPGPQRIPASFAGAVATFLARLHAAPVARMRALVDTEAASPAQWLAWARDEYAPVAGELPAHRRGSVEAFLARRPPSDAYVPVFCHHDLGIEHVLVDPGTRTVTGVIDWTDCAIADPAVDFGKLFRDLGPAALDAILLRYGADAGRRRALRERAFFYGRCTVFGELAYGLDPEHHTYRDNALTALAWLFPGGSR